MEKTNTLRAAGEPNQYGEKTLSQLAKVIRTDWPYPNLAANPYISAMDHLDSVKDNFGADTGATIVAYFLSNAAQWKGDTAREVKTELKRRLKAVGF
jgi:hypothetical protein